MDHEHEMYKRLDDEERTQAVALSDAVQHYMAALGHPKVWWVIEEIVQRTLGRGALDIDIEGIEDDDPEYWATRTLVIQKVLGMMIDESYWPSPHKEDGTT